MLLMWMLTSGQFPLWKEAPPKILIQFIFTKGNYRWNAAMAWDFAAYIFQSFSGYARVCTRIHP